MKLTKTFIDRIVLSEPGKISFYWDSEVKGYGIKVSETKKVYVVQTKMNGRTVRLTLGRHGVITESQARERAKKVLVKMSDGIDPRSEKKTEKILNMTLNDAIISYFSIRVLKTSTIKDINRHSRTTFADWMDKPITKITRDNVLEKFKKMSETAPAQANQAFRILRSILNYARAKYRDSDDMPILPENPVLVLSDAKAWNYIKPKSRKISLEKVGLAWNYINTLRKFSSQIEILRTHADYIAFLMLTGCRKTEATELTWDRVDLQERWWYLPDPKNKHPVTFPLSFEACRILSERPRISKFVFPANTVTGHIDDARRQFAKLSNEIGNTITAHDLRRTFRAIANECSVELWKCKLLMNHQDTDVTINSYTETSDLKYLLPEVDKISSWIIEQGKIADSQYEISYPFKRIA